MSFNRTESFELVDSMSQNGGERISEYNYVKQLLGGFECLAVTFSLRGLAFNF